MRYRVITATPASKRLAAAAAYRLLKVRTQRQNADVEVEADDSVGDIGALKKAHAIEELANSQRAAYVTRPQDPTVASKRAKNNRLVLCQQFMIRCIDRSHQPRPTRP